MQFSYNNSNIVDDSMDDGIHLSKYAYYNINYHYLSNKVTTAIQIFCIMRYLKASDEID